MPLRGVESHSRRIDGVLHNVSLLALTFETKGFLTSLSQCRPTFRLIGQYDLGTTRVIAGPLFADMSQLGMTVARQIK